MAQGSEFGHEIDFDPARARDLLREIPEQPGILALFGHDLPGQATGAVATQPYLSRAANLRRRVARLVDPPVTPGPDGQPAPSKRLNLRDRIARIAWSVTGSEFESLLLLRERMSTLFGPAEARRRLKLRTPSFVRLTVSAAHPRLYVTNRLSARTLAECYGPFASRVAAERYTDALMDLFQLRRCPEELEVAPTHPGCVYGEMRRCMAPCNTTCTAGEYAAEAEAVRQFLDTGGASLLAAVAADREAASEAMDFERAAALHLRWEKAKAAAALAEDLVRPIPQLRAAITQPAATVEGEHAEAAAVFLLDRGQLSGPERLSTLGVRAVREQTSVGSSLFAQPLMLGAVPLRPPETAGRSPDEASSETAAAEAPEQRAGRVLAHLEQRAESGGAAPVELATLSDHLALLRRWYYRPEKQRVGELFLPNADGSWPLRRILRGAARAAIGDPQRMEATDRTAAKAHKTRLLHPGREGVERVVPVLATPAAPTDPTGPPVFRSRRTRSKASPAPRPDPVPEPRPDPGPERGPDATPEPLP